MKKIVILSLLLFLCSFGYQNIKASDYLTYQEITYHHMGGRLLENYSDADYAKYYKKIKKSRFWGWRTFIAYENEKVYFTKETIQVIENQGTTPINQTFSFKSEEELKKQYSVSGTLGMEVKGDAYGFKLGLENKLKFSITATRTSSSEEEFEIKVLIDPYTKLVVQVKGEGKVSSGVAKYYRFFKNVKKGGWEIFVVTTEYYSLSKVKIDET